MIRRIISALLVGVAALVPAGAGATDPVRLAEDAPDSHTVVPGDTLWGISGTFLKEPWRWPEVWQLNRDQIRNPHWIYPGQIVVLDRSGAQPVLRLGKRIGGARAADRPLYEKRFPQVYSESAREAIPSIPIRVIQPFLVEPLVAEDKDDERAGIVVATQEGRVFTGPGDTIFATRIPPGVPLWNVYRKAQPLKEPVTGEILALANRCIAHNRRQHPKELVAVKAPGMVPAVIPLRDVYQQAELVAQRVLELRHAGRFHCTSLQASAQIARTSRSWTCVQEKMSGSRSTSAGLCSSVV